LIVGAAFYFSYNQLANSDASIGRSSLFYSIKIGRLSNYFHSVIESLESFFEILKWQNLVSFMYKIPKQRQQNKSSLP
jgi:hypothetical protein